MRAIILAAGSSQRLKPLTQNTPKCLLSIGEETILGRNLKILSGYSWSEIIIVNGFCGEQIEAFVKKSFSRLPITFRTNTDFSNTNNAYSLKLGLGSQNQPFVLLTLNIPLDSFLQSLLLR